MIACGRDIVFELSVPQDGIMHRLDNRMRRIRLGKES
jgi:hypothetical protein